MSALKSIGEYQKQLERHEKCNDPLLLPDLHLVLRLDASRYGTEWSNHKIDYPFDAEFGNALLTTSRALLASGMKTVCAYMVGDEISLLLDIHETANQRRRSRLFSHVASIASINFYQIYKKPIVFNTVLSELPTIDHVRDYFCWQRKCAFRNYYSFALGAILKKQGLSSKQISEKIGTLSEEEKIVFGEEIGLSFAEIPHWMLYGSFVWWGQAVANRISDSGIVQPFDIYQCCDSSSNSDQFIEFLNTCITGPAFCPAVQGEEIPFHTVPFESIIKPKIVEKVERKSQPRLQGKPRGGDRKPARQRRDRN